MLSGSVMLLAASVWKGATPAGRRLRNWGLAALFSAVVIVALSQAV
jgi:hypothetical protein